MPYDTVTELTLLHELSIRVASYGFLSVKIE